MENFWINLHNKPNYLTNLGKTKLNEKKNPVKK